MGNPTPRVILAMLGVLTIALAGCGGSSVTAGSAKSADQKAGTSETGQGGALFSGAVPWSTDVSGSAPSERSDAIIAALNNAGGWGTGGFNVDFAIPIFFADESTPRMPVVGPAAGDYCYGGNACDDVPAEMPVPENANFEGSPDLTCDLSGATEGQSDCHLLVVDRPAGTLYEVYNGTSNGSEIEALGFFQWELGKEYPDTLRGEQCTSADAAGFPIAALTPTADEVASGSVDHAIRFILPNDRMKADVYVAPATHAGGPESTDPDAPPYGVRFRLKPDFDVSSYSESQQVILTALKTHGMLLSDGGQVPLTFADDRTSTAKWADLGIDAQSFSALTPNDFDVVELGDEIPLTYDCVRN